MTIKPSNSRDGNHSVVASAAMGMAAGAIGIWALDRTDYFLWNRKDPATRAATRAVRPRSEAPAGAVVSELEEAVGRKLDREQHGLAEQLVHYAIGIGPAAGYAILRDKLPGRGPVRGLLYGLSVFLLQDEGINAVSRLGAKPRNYPWQDHGRGLIAHLV